MGSRKHNSAEARKEMKKTLYIAKLNNNPTSPRKTRLMADAIRGVEVNKALGILQYSQRESAPKLRKLLLSAIANWQQKNEGKRIEESNLYVKQISVDEGKQLKRLRTAPRGLGYRIKNGDTIIYNGADDNASGTSLILELGRKINENKEKFKRSIVIIAFDSEETGLNGSYYFANSKAKHNDILISNNTKLMMSLDMVGFLKTSKELKIVGVGLIDNYSQYFKNSSLNNKYKVKFKDFDNSIFTGSDHDSFLKKNIPSFYVSTGLKSPYHKPEDDAQLIDYEGINDISNFFYEAVLNFANVEQIKPSKKSLRMKKPIPSNYYGFELAIGNNKHYYSGGRMTGKTDFAYGAGFFGKFELSNFFAIKTGVNYNYLGANRYESEVKYHSASIPILLSLKANTPNNDYEFSVSIGGFYSYIFDSRANINGVEQKNYLNKNVFGVQTEVEFRFRRFIYGYQFQRSLSNILTDPISNGKTNQITNNFKIGYVF